MAGSAFDEVLTRLAAEKLSVSEVGRDHAAEPTPGERPEVEPATPPPASHLEGQDAMASDLAQRDQDT